MKEHLPQLPISLKQAAPAAREGSDPANEAPLRLGVHDLSRIEWTVLMPLPEKGEQRLLNEFTVDIPANLYSPINMWDYVQQFTRLESPEEAGAVQIERGDPDELRRDVLGVARRLKLLRDRFDREAMGAASMLVEALHPSLEAHLTEILDGALAVVGDVRAALVHDPSDGASAALIREWELADEWLSHQILDFLSAAQRVVDGVLNAPTSRVRELGAGWIERLSRRLADALADELRHREARGFLNPRPDSPAELSGFLERASTLKKHFQDVLFLDVSAFQVDSRVRNYTAIVAACLAAIWWLAFSIWYPVAPGVFASVGFVTFFVLFALAYALKDRMKELVRMWLSGRLTQLYGQRIVTLRLPQRADADRTVVLEAREKFDTKERKAEDPLNRVQATRRVIQVKYEMRANLHACPRLDKSGIHRLKHIFRWDLTPIFSRLDNAVKAVPVLDPETRRVRFVDAPREYRLPVRLTSTSGGRVASAEAQLVISKRGLERLENFVEAK